MILIVALDLRGPAASYEALYDVLKKQGVWWHYMRWTWILDTEHSPDEIIAAVKTHVQPEDKILVTRLTDPYQGLLKREEWNWIKQHLGQQPKSGSLKSG